MFKSLFFALFWHLWLCWRASYFNSDHLLLKNLLRTLPTLLAQQCWELLRPFAWSLINVWLLWTYSVTDTACRTPYNTCVTRILCAQEPWLLVCVKIFIYTIILTFCCYCFSLPWYRNIEEAVKFTGLPQHRQLPYATKQLIAREVKVLPMLTHLRLKIILEIH